MKSNTAHVNEYLTHMERALRRQPATIYKYRQVYASMLSAIDKPLSQTTTSDLNDWLQRERGGRAEAGIAAPATIKVEVTTLRSLFRYLHDKGVLSHNPAAGLIVPTVHNDEPKPVPVEVWTEVWSSALSNDERVALGLGYFCGFRRHEVTGLKVEQFVEVPGPLIVGLKRKGGKRQGFRWRSCVELYTARLPHLIGPTSSFTDALAALLAQRCDYSPLLPWSRYDHEVWPVMFNKRMVTIAQRLNVPPSLFTPHRLRHSFGTNLCSVGVPIQVVSRLMGHSSLAITQRYVDVGQDPLASFLDSGQNEPELLTARPSRGMY